MDTAAIENLVTAPHEVMLEVFNQLIKPVLSESVAAAVLTVVPLEALS